MIAGIWGKRAGDSADNDNEIELQNLPPNEDENGHMGTGDLSDRDTPNGDAIPSGWGPLDA
ncbi:hypothetical protein B0T09DRAFT_401874 [Sordaria sp. MPI-SDFR-AT-0083]|nr:hypothetical protein B0T09DRAFT_401874 [Sordaria sp. MPI-SDFR-AT-0083]